MHNTTHDRKQNIDRWLIGPAALHEEVREKVPAQFSLDLSFEPS